MKVSRIAFSALSLAVFAALPAATSLADSIAVWNFNNSDFSNSTANGALTFTGTPADGGTSNLTYSGGTTKGASGTDTAGNALAIRVGTNAENNNSSLVFTLNTLGYSGIQFSYATRSSNATTAFTEQVLSYSVNGSAYTVINDLTPVPTSSTYTLESINLSAMTALDNAAQVTFKLTLSGGTNATSTNTFDNFVIAGTAATPATTPLPSAASLGLMGLITLPFVVKRRRSLV